MTTTLQIRIGAKLKRDLAKKFKEAGVDMSTGFRLWAKQAVESKEPIVRTVNGFTPEYERNIIEGVREAELHGKYYSDVRQMLREI